MGDRLDLEHASVGLKAELAKLRQVLEALTNTEVSRVVYDCLGAQRRGGAGLQSLQVLLDPRALVIGMQSGNDTLSDNASPEASGRAAIDAPAEDQLDLAGSSDIQVLADDFLEEETTHSRPI